MRLINVEATGNVIERPNGVRLRDREFTVINDQDEAAMILGGLITRRADIAANWPESTAKDYWLQKYDQLITDYRTQKVPGRVVRLRG